MKKIKVLIGAIVLLAVGVTTATAALAAFGDKGNVLGSTFSVGNSDLKLLRSLQQGTEIANQADSLEGPMFSNIIPNWQGDYLLKIYNNGTTAMNVSSNANYLTANDPEELRSILFVEPFLWVDDNNNGTAEGHEVGSSLGKKTITKWKTEGFDFGRLGTAETLGVVLRFSADDISETKMGQQAVFDFIFDAVSIN